MCPSLLSKVTCTLLPSAVPPKTVVLSVWKSSLCKLIFSPLFQHAHKDRLPTKHIHTPLFRAIVYHPWAHPSAHCHFFSLCLRAVAHLYKPVQGPTDGLSVSIWALPLALVCTAMPAGLELNQTHLVQPHWYRWCFTMPIRTAQQRSQTITC